MKFLHAVIAVICLFTLSIFPLACSDAKPTAFSPDYEGALKSAKKDGKPVLLYFFSKYCRYCTLMEQETLADKEIGGILTSFHVVKIDGERSFGLARRYSVVGYPSCWFLDPSGNRIMEAPGYLNKALFKKILEYVRGNHYKTKDIRQYLKGAG